MKTKGRFTTFSRCMAAAALCLTGIANAAQVSFGTAAPTVGPNDIANLSGASAAGNNVSAGDANAVYTADDRPIQGQTFTTGGNSTGYRLTAVTLRQVTYDTYALIPDLTYTIRITSPSGGTLSVLASETASVPAATAGNFPTILSGNNLGPGSGSYITFTLATPVSLNPNTTYGFDIGGGSTRHYWEMDGTSANPNVGGVAYSSGANGTGTTSLTARTGDRVFKVALTAVSAPGYAATVLADGPIGYWGFNGAPPTAVNSGSLGAAADGTYVNGATSGVEAPRPPQFLGFDANNTALQLDGVDDFVRSAPRLLNNLSNVTMSGWIRRSGAQRNRTGLFGQDNLIEFGYIDNNTIQAWVDNFSTPVNVPNSFPNLEWEHLALVVDGNALQMTVYTNGRAAGSAAIPSAFYNSLNSTASFVIGGDTFGGGGVTFGGQMDEVALFDKALSAEKIASHYFTTVAQAPIVTRQPQGTNIFEGQTLVLSVGAVGTPELRYQWLFFGQEIVGQTSATLAINNATPDASGNYSVLISNSYGSVESASAEANVFETQPPLITQEPVSQSRYAGRTARFTVVATGGANLQYQWQFNGADIPGATGTTLTLNNISAANVGNYQVIVRNNVGTTRSAVATLSVVTPNPGSYESAVLAAQPMAYWRLGEASGSTAFDYWGGFDGTYTDVALGAAGAIAGDSNTAAEFNGTGSFVGTPLSLNGLPQVTMTGWIRRGGTQDDRTGLFGQNDLIEFGYIDNNTLQLWVDDFATPVNVSPNPFPDNEWDFLAVVINNGEMSVYANGAVAGSASLGSSDYGETPYKFNIGGGGIFDAAGNYFLGGIDEVAVFNRALSDSQVANLYFTGSHRPPVIATQPPSTNLFEGGTLSVCVEAFGAPPLSYKWFYFGTEVSGQTGPCLTIPNVTTEASGNYEVEVSSPYGTVVSGVASVEVLPANPPIITQDPQSQTRYAGGSATFSAAVIGSPPITYQWQHNGANVPGATGTTLTLNNLQGSDGGDYRLIAANVLGKATSAVATLTVIVPRPGSYEAALIAKGPMAYWRLGETSGNTAYDYVGGNHGTYNNVTLGLEGALFNDTDTAAGFDGLGSYVSTPVNFNGIGSALTMVGWIMRNGAQQDRTGLFGQNDVVEFGYINNDTIQAWVDNYEEHVDVTPNPIPDQQWGFVALTLNNGLLSVQVNDGVAGTAMLPSGDYGSSEFKFNIGGGGVFDAAGNFFNGRIDEVALFNRALSSADLNALFAAGGPNQCPVANPVSVFVDQNSSVNFTLAGSDPNGDPLQYIVTRPPASGTLIVQPGTGAATYTPTPGFCGPDSFTYKVNDGVCDSAEAAGTITVRCVNRPPTGCAAAIIPAECVLTSPDGTTLMVLSLNDSSACVSFQGSATDPEGQPLQYSWSTNGTAFAVGAVVSNCFGLGCHTVTFLATDPLGGSCSTTVHFCVVTPGEAVEQTIALVEGTALPRTNKRPLIAILKAGAASFDRGDSIPALQQLSAFQNKVRAQVGNQDPTTAQELIDYVQRIMETIACSAVTGSDQAEP